MSVNIPAPFDLLYGDRWSKRFYYLIGVSQTANQWVSLMVLIIFK